ncbi:hypothetical protein [Actinopolyspora mzabensis]|nr:hypothetical protein [Actinopolyspora mzabensis]
MDEVRGYGRVVHANEIRDIVVADDVRLYSVKLADDRISSLYDSYGTN